MKTEQLQQIIKDKNERLEQSALRTAESIIETIVKEQQTILTSEANIKALRKELVSLQVKELDSNAILGEG